MILYIACHKNLLDSAFILPLTRGFSRERKTNSYFILDMSYYNHLQGLHYS